MLHKASAKGVDFNNTLLNLLAAVKSNQAGAVDVGRHVSHLWAALPCSPGTFFFSFQAFTRDKVQEFLVHVMA